MMMVKMRCKKCGEEKPIHAFFKTETCLHGFYEYCHDCIEQTLNRYLDEENQEKVRVQQKRHNNLKEKS